MKRFRVVAVIVALQIALAAVYFVVGRERSTSESEGLGHGAPERIDLPAPAFRFRNRQGTLVPVRGPAVIHFWATWCPPCREELPAFLEMELPQGTEVLAVSLDSSWQSVERFTSDLPMARIVLGSGVELERALGESVVPVTYVMDAHRRLRLRFVGPRDWRHPTMRKALRDGLARR